jgi:hypothetical protein
MLHKRRLAGERRSHKKQAKCRALCDSVCGHLATFAIGREGFAIRVQRKSVGTLQINTAALHTQQVLSRCQLIIDKQPIQCNNAKKKCQVYNFDYII